MDNAEEIMQCLEEFSKMKPKDIPHELDDYLGYVAKTGDPVFKWSIIKCLFREKLLNVIADFYESTLSIELPPCPNVDSFNYERMKTNLLEKLDSFHGAPFTVQRISELLTNPRKEYNRADKFMRAIEKNILVVSTREPGRFAEGECENDPSYNGMPDANDSGVETGFPCNDLADPNVTPQPYEVGAENMEPAFSVNVDSIDTSPSTSVLSGASREECFGASASERQQGLDVPSTSGEPKTAETIAADTVENESVICSTATPAALEQTADNVQPMSSTTEESPQTQESEHIETPIPSTSEAVPVKKPETEPEPSTSKSNLEIMVTPEEEASSSQQDVECSNLQPEVQEVEAAPSLEAVPEDEPSSSGSENLDSYVGNNEVEAPVVSSNDEAELQCKEAVCVDDRPECDTNSALQEPQELPVEEEPLVDQGTVDGPEENSSTIQIAMNSIEEKGLQDDGRYSQSLALQAHQADGDPSQPQQQDEEKTESHPVEVPGDCETSEEDKVTSFADSSADTKSEVEGGGDCARETSVIHTTSPDEPMDVEECQTSSSEQSQP